MKAEALGGAAAAATTPELNLALVGAALELTDEAVLGERYDLAMRFSRLALVAARKGKDGELLKEVVARNKEVQELRKQ
jgi:hypothetical protein